MAYSNYRLLSRTQSQDQKCGCVFLYEYVYRCLFDAYPPHAQLCMHLCIAIYVRVSVSICSVSVVTEGMAVQEVLTSSSISEPHPGHSKDVHWTWLTGDELEGSVVSMFCVCVFAYVLVASHVSHQFRICIFSTLCYFKVVSHISSCNRLSLCPIELSILTALSFSLHFPSCLTLSFSPRAKFID